MKRLLLLASLWSACALAQQADITGAQLLSGAADAKLQSMARDAASSGRKLVISAPEYWHEMILEQVRRGGGDNLEVEVRDSFAESVLVREESTQPPDPVAAPEAVAPAPVATPAPALAPAAAPTPVAAPRPAAPPVAKPAVAAPTPRPQPAPVAPPVAAREPAASAPATTPAPPPAPAPVTAAPAPVAAASAPAAAAPAPAPAPAPATVTPAPAPAAAPAAAPAPRRSTRDAEIASIKRRVEQNLNGGEPVTRSLTQTGLEPGDVIYDQGLVKAVLRRGSVRNQLYWLDGEIELRRIELKELGPRRYQVMERIRNEGARPTLRTVRTTESQAFKAAAPAAHAAERKQLEQRYNAGNPISSEIPATGLRQRDIVYVGDALAVVVRVNGLALERYWLVGEVDLGRSELIKDGANKYRVLQDINR
ncbi:MAG: hypothetical protein KA911_07450 [Xanthomonadales bacterium]|nr:hypothetical protein [Xanthomonadales bacterium]